MYPTQIPLTHSLTHSLTLAHSLTRPLTHSLTHSLTRAPPLSAHPAQAEKGGDFSSDSDDDQPSEPHRQ